MTACSRWPECGCGTQSGPHTCEGDMSETFNVCQFFEDGSYEYVRRNVSPEEAALAFRTYTHNPAAKIGLTKRVIITDGGDCTNAEWKYGEGLVFPKPESEDAI